jgi:hypothetical protein
MNQAVVPESQGFLARGNQGRNAMKGDSEEKWILRKI